MKTWEASVDSLKAMRDSDLRALAKKRARKYKDVWWDLAKTVYVVRVMRHYTRWGYASFSDYAQMELGLDIRSVQYWVRIFDKFHLKIGIPEDDIKEISWSKLKVILGVANKKNATKWLAKAQEHKKTDLENIVHEYTKGLSPKNSGLVRFGVSCTVEERELFEVAMGIARKLVKPDVEREGQFLEFVCAEFLKDNVFMFQDEIPAHIKERLLSKIKGSTSASI